MEDNLEKDFDRITFEKRELIEKLIKTITKIDENLNPEIIKQYNELINKMFNDLNQIDQFILKRYGKEIFDKQNEFLKDKISQLINLIKQKEIILEASLNDIKKKVNSIKKFSTQNNVNPHFYDEKI